MTFNSKLNFDTHISSIIARAKQRLYLLRKCFTSCNEYALIRAFKCYVIPLLEYCCQVWSPSSLSDILRLESVQRAFTRSLYSCFSLSYRERLIKCNLQSLEYRRLCADLTLFYKVVYKLTDINFGESLKPVQQSVTRGHSKRYVIPASRLNCRKNFFINRTIPI